MFQPLSLFVALRYVRSRHHTFFVSLITWVSLLGVALGVAALIVILSIMNGFESDLRERLLGLSEHARVERAGAAAPEADQALAARLRALPGVVGVAPYIEITGLIVHAPDMLPVVVRGVDPVAEPSVTRLATLLSAGSLATLAEGGNRVLIGRDLSDQLGLRLGDPVTLLVPESSNGLPEPHLRQFMVGGIYESEQEENRDALVIAHLADVRTLAPHAEGSSGLRLRFAEATALEHYLPAVRAAVAASGGRYTVSDWAQQNASYFRAIRIEKTMMSLILLLIVAVAAFNIVAMLMMVVSEKRTDIAIMRTFGVGQGTLTRTFIAQGLLIGWVGVAAGVAVGVLVARHVDRIAPWLERTLHFQFFDADVFYDTGIPSEVHAHDVLWIGALALALTLLSTLYPAWRAAQTAPAEALRYE